MHGTHVCIVAAIIGCTSVIYTKYLCTPTCRYTGVVYILSTQLFGGHYEPTQTAASVARQTPLSPLFPTGLHTPDYMQGGGHKATGKPGGAFSIYSGADNANNSTSPD